MKCLYIYILNADTLPAGVNLSQHQAGFACVLNK